MNPSSSRGKGEEPHVLAVDDNLIDRKLVDKLLKNSSCKVTTAENGLRVLEYLGQSAMVICVDVGDGKPRGGICCGGYGLLREKNVRNR